MTTADITIEESSQGENFLSRVNQISDCIVDDIGKLTFFENPKTPLQPKFQIPSAAKVKPESWIKSMMVNDLNQGVVGALDSLYPGIKRDDIYNAHRRAGLDDVPEMGDLVLTGDEWEASIMWWNAETIGNWWDGFIRHAFLTNNPTALEKAKSIIENLLESQDQDGYIGIYQPSLRYQHEGANGELWAQTTALRTLLSYYEFTKEERILDAVEKAMAVSMKEYGPQGRNPFCLKNEFGGATHGLMLTDVCDTLHRLTGQSQYQDYATFLYKDFSRFPINRAFNDFRYPYLMDKEGKFESHGVHTYEHLRSLLQSYYWTGYPELEEAWDNALYKLGYTILPSGAGHGAEWIAGLVADPDFTATEFCTMFELRNSLLFALEKTGDISFADHAEILTFNGMMGFRNPTGTAITYNKSDNCCILNSHHQTPHGEEKDVRYKYSPTHSDPAVCCVPNYGRNLPTYLQHMWMEEGDELVAMLYGPSSYTTEKKDKTLTVTQRTDYPLSDQVQLTFTASSPFEKTIKLRKPGWSKHTLVVATGADIEEQEQFILVTKAWETDDTVDITFTNEVSIQQANNGDYYYQRGPIVYAAPIAHQEVTIKEYQQGEFRDYHCLPLENSVNQLSYDPSLSHQAVYCPALGEKSWYKSMPCLDVVLINSQTQKSQQVRLQPMGSTILRRVSFKAVK